jgi:hypothetical protein
MSTWPWLVHAGAVLIIATSRASSSPVNVWTMVSRDVSSARRVINRQGERKDVYFSILKVAAQYPPYS